MDQTENGLIVAPRTELGVSLVDECMRWEPEVTDWAEVMRNPGDSGVIIEGFKDMEPLPNWQATETLEVWRLQQRLRLALRKEKGVPIEVDMRCGICGQRPADPALGRCLWCAELAEQLRGSLRGGWNFGFEPVFNTDNGAWGILMCTRYDRESLLSWMVGWGATFAEARSWLYPLMHPRVQWKSVVDVDWVVNQELPLKPEAWWAQLREWIGVALFEEEKHSFRWEIDGALRDCGEHE
jgi:hypothetical protein